MDKLKYKYKEDLKNFDYNLEEIILTKKDYLIKSICNFKDQQYFVKGIYLRKLFKNDFLKFQLNKELNIVKSIKTNSIYLQQFYDFFYTKNFAIFVYEYFPKGNISIKYKNMFLKKEEILKLIKDVFLGLEELRKSNIYHKYLCEEFIFLYKNNFKLGGFEYCDFVNSSKLSDINHYKYIKSVNNINTLSPELIFNKFTGSKTPFFSLGIIIYYLINKNYPFHNPNFEYLKSIYLEKLFKIDLKNIDDELKYIIVNCLLIDYNHRISSTSFKEEIHFINKKYLKRNYNENLKYLFNEKTSSILNSFIKQENFKTKKSLLNNLNNGKMNVRNSLNFINILKISNDIKKKETTNNIFVKYKKNKTNNNYSVFKNTNFNKFKLINTFKNIKKKKIN